jgi:hypothetical protein
MNRIIIQRHHQSITPHNRGQRSLPLVIQRRVPMRHLNTQVVRQRIILHRQRPRRHHQELRPLARHMIQPLRQGIAPQHQMIIQLMHQLMAQHHQMIIQLMHQLMAQHNQALRTQVSRMIIQLVPQRIIQHLQRPRSPPMVIQHRRMTIQLVRRLMTQHHQSAFEDEPNSNGGFNFHPK